MDARTLRYYDQNAEEVCRRYEQAGSGIARYFATAFPRDSRILDIGVGSGRDLNTLVEESYQAYGVEPSPGLRAEARRLHPHLAERIFAGGLPDLPDDLGEQYDGILCSAVFMHIPVEAHFDAAFALRRLLHPHGRLLLSVPSDPEARGGRGQGDGDPRDAYGRLFTPVHPDALSLLFERLGFQRIGRWDDGDSLGRPGVGWTTLLFERSPGQGARPIDRIEAVLNRDAKTATYKLALFRALNDIALTHEHLARWMPDGRVGVPLAEVVERWVYYYWPLVEGDPRDRLFIPQINGERADGGNRPAFRRHLEELVRYFQPLNGLDGFLSAQRSGDLGQADPLHRAVTRALATTIIKGPVRYAGGSLRDAETGERVPLFSYDGRQRLILFPGDIWRELCLSGHWIRDALILRWAELTTRISKGSVTPRDVIHLLLKHPDPRRDQSVAKGIFNRLDDKECVWSGRSLVRGFDVDHVLPYALWRNNDLWNLLPADPKVNNRKRDKLPEQELLRRRRPVILDYWAHLQEAMPRRFGYEASRFTGHDDGDLERLFSVLAESVEKTALQFGSARWTW